MNAIVVAEVYTGMYEQLLQAQGDSKAAKAQIEQRIPLGQRMTTPEEIAYQTVFLASNKATHTTGQLVYVDGGVVHLGIGANQT